MNFPDDDILYLGSAVPSSGSGGGGSDPRAKYLGTVTNGGSFPTQRGDGSPLVDGDYVKPSQTSTFPFTISGVTFTNKLDQAMYVASSNSWILNPGSVQDTSEIPVANKTQESISGNSTTQQGINIENTNLLKTILKDGEFKIENNKLILKLLKYNDTYLINTELNIDALPTENSENLIDSNGVWIKDISSSSYFKIENDKLKLKIVLNDDTEIINREFDIDSVATQNSTNFIYSKAVWDELLKNTSSFTLTNHKLNITLINNKNEEIFNQELNVDDLVSNSSHNLTDSYSVWRELIDTANSYFRLNTTTHKIELLIKNNDNDTLLSGDINFIIDERATENSTNLIESNGVWLELLDLTNSYCKIENNKLKFKLQNNNGDVLLNSEFDIDTTATQNSINLINSNAVYKELLNNTNSTFEYDDTNSSKDVINLELQNNNTDTKINKTIDFNDKLVLETKTQIITNKTIDVDNNTLSNVETDNFKSSALATSTDNIRNYASSVDTKLTTEKFLQKTLQNIATPTNNNDAVNKKYVDDEIAEVKGEVMTFKGFISTTEPTGTIQDGRYWYNSNTLPTTFPINVKVWDATNSEWSTETIEYTPADLDLWSNLNNDKGYYWFGNSFSLLDENVLVDNITIEKNLNGELQIKDSGITFVKLNSNLTTNTISPSTTASNEVLPTEIAVSEAIEDIAIDNSNSTFTFDDTTHTDRDILDLTIKNADGTNLLSKDINFGNQKIVFTNKTQTLRNKTINADDNTISDLELDNFKSGVVDVDGQATGTLSNNDTNFPTSKLLKRLLEAQPASLDIQYNNNTNIMSISLLDANGNVVDTKDITVNGGVF